MSVPTPILQYNLSDASVKGLLPSGYTPLAYIESTGTQYIDTGYSFTALNGVAMEGKAIFTDTSSTGYAVLFGSYGNTTSFNVVLRSNSYLYFDYGGRNSLCQYTDIIKNTYFEFIAKISGTTLTTIVNGVTKTSNGSISISSPARPAYLFAYNENTAIHHYVKAKVYYWRIFSSSGLLMDLRPARRDSDGVIGMYDLVSRTFKTNSGSGAFIAGPELAVGKGGGKSLPEEYLLVEYLESHGNANSPCLNFTNRALQADDIIQINTSLNSKTNNTLPSWLGGANNVQIYVNVSSGNLSYWQTTNVEAVSPESGTSITLNQRYVIKSKIKTAVSEWRLFDYNINSYPINGRIEMMSVTRGTSIIVKLIPCYRKSDMKPGMYDVVNGEFKTSATSGEFILGPSVNSGYTSEPNAGSGPNLVPNWRSSSSWTNDGSTLSSIIGDTLNITYGSSSNARIYYSTSNVWTEIGAKYTVSGWIRSTSGTATVRFSRSCGDYGANISATTTWQKFSTTITTTATSDAGTLSILPNANILIKDLCLLKSISNKFVEGLYVNCNSIYDANKGWCAGFDGNTSKFIIPKNVILSLTDSFTIAGWFNITSWSSSYQMLFLFARETTSSAWTSTIVGLHRDSTTSKLDFAISNASSGTMSNCLTPLNLSLNTWYHIVCVYNKSSNSQIYINGALSKQYNHSIVPDVANVSRCQLGMADYAGTLMYKCAENVLNFMIFDSALTAAQVKELYGK